MIKTDMKRATVIQRFEDMFCFFIKMVIGVKNGEPSKAASKFSKSTEKTDSYTKGYNRGWRRRMSRCEPADVLVDLGTGWVWDEVVNC